MAAATAGYNAQWLGDHATGRRMGEVSAEAYRRIGDSSGLAIALGIVAFSTIEVDPLGALGMIEANLDLYRESGDVLQQGRYLGVRATAEYALGRLSDARASIERSVDLARQAGDQFFALFAGIYLAQIKLLMGEIPEGIADYRAMLEMSRALDLRMGIANLLEYFGEVAVWAGDMPRAVRLGATAARIKEELGGGISPWISGVLEPLVVGREQLSAADFDREVATGRAMDIETAIEEALATPLPTTVPSR